MNKVYKYFILILLLISPIACRPFSISADGGSLSAPFVGFNVHIIDIDSQLNQIDRGNYRIASHTYGATGQLNCSSWRSTNDSSPCDIYELESQGNSQVAGIQIKVGDISVINLTNDEFVGTIINRIYEIEFILDNSYVGYITFSDGSNTYTNYVNGTSFKHNFWSTTPQTFNITITDYSLYRIYDPIVWNIPYESLAYNYYLFQKYQYSGFTKLDYYNYPMFDIKQNDEIYSYYANKDINLTLIFGVNSNISSEYLFTNNFSFPDHTFVSGTTLISSRLGVNKYYCVYKVILKPNSSGVKSITYTGSPNLQFIGIYAFRNDIDIPNIGTEFALRYGLINKELNDLDHIANGTTQSNQSSAELDYNNNTMSDTIGQYDNIENSINNSLNNSLNNIDTNNTPSAMGSKFQASAIWVTNQFNRMTNNTPFGSILGFSLLLGLSLLIIGRVFK